MFEETLPQENYTKMQLWFLPLEGTVEPLEADREESHLLQLLLAWKTFPVASEML